MGVFQNPEVQKKQNDIETGFRIIGGDLIVPLINLTSIKKEG